jgi:hypothetical protein
LRRERQIEQPSLLLYRVIDGLVDSFFPVLAAFDDRIDDARSATRSPDCGIAELPGLGEEDERYFRDVYDHLIRISELIDSYRDLLTGAMDVYLSTVSNRLNSVMKQLTIIATVFLPLSWLTGSFDRTSASWSNTSTARKRSSASDSAASCSCSQHLFSSSSVARSSRAGDHLRGSPPRSEPRRALDRFNVPARESRRFLATIVARKDELVDA